MGKLSDILKNYSRKNPVRFHMPGGKGRAELFDMPDMSADVTELYFTDNLYNPDADTGIIHGLEEQITKCFFPERNDVHSIVSCGGATLCIQAALLSAVRMHSGESKFLICDRASHISLINTLALLDIEPLWIYPEFDKDKDKTKKKFAECVEEYVKIYDNKIIGVFVTSPDYYGTIKDIKAIADECRKYSLLLIADNSHGSHLAFYNNGELHAINTGADISIDSVHKTLPAFTGAAVLHASKRLDKEMLLRSSMRAFASTSPSFLILQSIDAMTDYLSERGRDEHKILLENINQFRREAENIGFSFDCIKSGLSDPYRIVLRLNLTESGNINNTTSGEILYDYLCFGFCSKNIVCEFFAGDCVILIPSIFNSENDFLVLAEALKQFADEYNILQSPVIATDFHKFSKGSPTATIALSQALRMPRKKIRGDMAAGRISAEAVTVYPPGIPIIMPGELIDADAVNTIKQLCKYIDVIDIID